jgi:hypothetical protein
MAIYQTIVIALCLIISEPSFIEALVWLYAAIAMVWAPWLRSFTAVFCPLINSCSSIGSIEPIISSSLCSTAARTGMLCSRDCMQYIQFFPCIQQWHQLRFLLSFCKTIVNSSCQIRPGIAKFNLLSNVYQSWSNYRPLHSIMRILRKKSGLLLASLLSRLSFQVPLPKLDFHRYVYRIKNFYDSLV